MQLLAGFKLLRIPIAANLVFYRDVLVKKDTHSDSTPNMLLVSHVDKLLARNQCVLKRSFECFGKVKSVKLRVANGSNNKHSQPADIVILCYITFYDVASLEQALNAAVTLERGLCDLRLGGMSLASCCLKATGLPQDLAQLNFKRTMGSYRGTEVLQKHVNVRLAAYDEETVQQKQEYQANVTDENGFIMVRRAGARSVDGASPENRKVRSTSKKKRKGIGESDFYRFQLRDKKRAELASARQQNMRDATAIMEMKHLPSLF